MVFMKYGKGSLCIVAKFCDAFMLFIEKKIYKEKSYVRIATGIYN